MMIEERTLGRATSKKDEGSKIGVPKLAKIIIAGHEPLRYIEFNEMHNTTFYAGVVK